MGHIVICENMHVAFKYFNMLFNGNPYTRCVMISQIDTVKHYSQEECSGLLGKYKQRQDVI